MLGDMSADKHVAKIIARLKSEAPDIRIWGIGGPQVLEQDFDALMNCKDFPFGITSSFRQIPFLFKLRSYVLEEIEKRKPDAVLLVDYGGFNLPLGTALRKRFPELPIIYFISPQVWGSRPWRINAIAKFSTKMLVIFPFEEQLYRSYGVPTKFVGHPLPITLPPKEELGTREQFCQLLNLDSKKFVIGIFPGSRKSEVRTHVSIVIQAINELLARRDDVQFVISAMDADKQQHIEKQIRGAAKDSTVVIQAERNYQLMQHSDVLWVKSGTTALEATIYATPMLIFYATDWLSFLLYLAFKQVKWVGMPNLLSGEILAPELIKLDCRAELLVRYTGDLLDVPGLRREVSQKLAGLRSKLGEGEYTVNCASEILSALDSESRAK
jgi:lipid-A-disaccharide synthase